MYHLNETPVGTVNGVNTTFTTANNLYQMVVVAVDGVIYTGLVTYGLANAFTLADAPTVSITVSYYDSAASAPATGSLLVSDVKTVYARFKRDITDVSNATFIDWCDWVNKFAFRHILGIDPERLVNTTTVIATAGDLRTYLPTDFRDLQRFGCGFYEYKNSNQYNAEPLLLTNPNSGLTGASIQDGYVYWTPYPISETKTYQLRYAPTEPEIDALTDYFIAPLSSAYMKYLIDAIDVFYSQWDEDIPMEGIGDARFARLLDELSRNIKQTPNVYSLDDFTNNF